MVPRIARILDEAGVHPASLTVTQPSLDDVFLDVTGRRYRAEGEDNNGGQAAGAQGAAAGAQAAGAR